VIVLVVNFTTKVYNSIDNSSNFCNLAIVKDILNILKFTKKFWPYYLITGSFIVLISLLNLAGPLLNKSIVDIIVNRISGENGNTNNLVVLLVLIIISDLLITFFTNISGYLGDVLGVKLNSFLSSQFYEHILKLEIQYFDNELSGTIINKLQRGIDNISNFINQVLNNFLPFLLTAFFTIIALAFYSWQVALLLAILFPIYIVISDRSSKTWRKQQEKINKIQDKIQGRAFEAISSIRIVKSFLREGLELKSYNSNRLEVEKDTKIQSQVWHKFDIYRRLSLNVILFLIYAFVIYSTYLKHYTLGEMTLLLQLVTQARFPLFAMSFILGQIQQAQAGSKDFFGVLKQEIKINDKENALELKSPHGDIEFKKVSFSYQNDKQVLNLIDFKLKAGEKLAIVGESGEGKSTIANLILRFYEPQTGVITIDNQNIQDITQSSLHKSIGVVLQDSFLFSGTIANNIKYGNEKATQEEIVMAAKAANADSFISSFEKGYETEIGERGIKLSGGQKQRISIARAILKNSPILILDEATSSLDSKAEKEVQIALDKLMQGKTTIIIAHRLSTIKNVNQIIVLKSGHIVESGSPAELAVKNNGVYAEFLSLQITAVTPDISPRLKEYQLY